MRESVEQVLKGLIKLQEIYFDDDEIFYGLSKLLVSFTIIIKDEFSKFLEEEKNEVPNK